MPNPKITKNTQPIINAEAVSATEGLSKAEKRTVKNNFEDRPKIS